MCSGIVQHRSGAGQSRSDHPGPPDLAGPPRWRGLVQGCVLAQFGDDDNGLRHALAMPQELPLGVAAIGHHHQVPVRQPTAQADQHLLGVVGDRLVPAAFAPVVAGRHHQRGQKRQRPVSTRPPDTRQQQQAHPLQSGGHHHLVVGRAHRIRYRPWAAIFRPQRRSTVSSMPNTNGSVDEPRRPATSSNRARLSCSGDHWARLSTW